MLNEIQKIDYDRYLALLFCPKDKRADLETLISFNIELARIRQKVTEPMMGHIRFQWWREAMDEIFDESRVVRRHDIAIKLRDLVSRHKLDKADFLQLIDAREVDLQEVPFKTLQELKSYAFNTSYPLNRLMLDVLGVQDARIIDSVKSLSTAWALCAILRSAYKNFNANRSVFPQELMDKAGLQTTDFGKPDFPERAKTIVKELYDIANAELQQARTEFKKAERVQAALSQPVALNLVTVCNHLRQIKKNDYDIFSRTLNPYLGAGSLLKIYLKAY